MCPYAGPLAPKPEEPASCRQQCEGPSPRPHAATSSSPSCPIISFHPVQPWQLQNEKPVCVSDPGEVSPSLSDTP